MIFTDNRNTLYTYINARLYRLKNPDSLACIILQNNIERESFQAALCKTFLRVIMGRARDVLLHKIWRREKRISR